MTDLDPFEQAVAAELKDRANRLEIALPSPPVLQQAGHAAASTQANERAALVRSGRVFVLVAVLLAVAGLAALWPRQSAPDVVAAESGQTTTQPSIDSPGTSNEELDYKEHLGLDLATSIQLAQESDLDADYLFVRSTESPAFTILTARAGAERTIFEVSTNFDSSGAGWEPEGFDASQANVELTIDHDEAAGTITLEVFPSDNPSWMQAFDSPPRAFYGDDDLLLITTRGRVHAFSTMTGQELWTVALRPAEVGVRALVDGTDALLVTKIEREEHIEPARVLVIELATGDVGWATELEAGSIVQWAPLVIHDSKILVSTVSSSTAGGPSVVHALDRTTGVPSWQTAIAERPQATFHGIPPIVVDSIVLATGPGGRIAALEVSDGGIKWSSDGAEGSRPIGLTSDGALIVEDGSGNRRQVDLATGVDR